MCRRWEELTSSSVMSQSNSRLMDSAWALMTGTRMQVAVMLTSFCPQILWVSFTIFISSSLYPFSVMGELCEKRLKAYCRQGCDCTYNFIKFPCTAVDHNNVNDRLYIFSIFSAQQRISAPSNTAPHFCLSNIQNPGSRFGMAKKACMEGGGQVQC